MYFEGFDLSGFWEESDYAKEAYTEASPTDGLIAEIEAELGYRLPGAYIALMRSRNGGIPFNTAFPTRFPTTWAADHVAISGIMGIGREKRYSLCGSLGSQFMIDEWEYPAIGVAICDCPSAGHDMIFLDYRACGPEGEPKVVHVDQENDYAITPLADSFEAFIRGLVSEDDFDFDDDGKDSGADEGARLLNFSWDDPHITLVNLVDIWNDGNQYSKCIQAIEAVPEGERSYALRLRLARAYSNLAVLGDGNCREENDEVEQETLNHAIDLLQAMAEEGENDAQWHKRMANALYMTEDRAAEALPYARRWLELDPTDGNPERFIADCEAYLNITPCADCEHCSPKMYGKAEMEAVEAHIERYFGKFDYVFHEKVSPDIHVDICVIPPAAGRDYYTLVTMGMGARPMHVPEELAAQKLERAELVIALPPDWKVDEASLPDERWYWPFRLLKSTARLSGELDTWLGWGHTVSLKEGETYAENTDLCGCMLIEPQGTGQEKESVCCVLPDGDEVNFYQVIPLYQEEMAFKIAHSAEALLKELAAFSFVVDIHRPRAIAGEGGAPAEDSLPPLAARLMAYLGCPCQYFPPMADDDPIMDAYRAARERGAQEGFVPMIVSVDEVLWEALAISVDCEEDDSDTVLREAAVRYRKEILSNPTEDGGQVLQRMSAGDDEAQETALAGGEGNDRLLSIWDYSTRKTRPLLLAQIPVEHPWEIFAYLPFGNWNDCPDTPELMAVVKRWYERYGAVPAALSGDTLELLLPQPVKAEEALALAREHLTFCPDVLGEGTLGGLADSLRQSMAWFFWWD